MASNLYAKTYRTEPRNQKKNEEFAFVSYMDEPNTFSVVSSKRLFDIDKFRKGFIREKNKTFRIMVERAGKYILYNTFVQYFISFQGTLAEMEHFAKETEEASAYTLNTERWYPTPKCGTNDKDHRSTRIKIK
jgi:hypothetical protein